MEKALFDDLIARKLQRDNDKVKFTEIEIPSTGKTLLFKKPKDREVSDMLDELGASNGTTSSIVETYKKLIYNTCDALQDPALQKEMEIFDPYDTVSALFDVADILIIGEELSKFAGLDKLEKQIKNS